MYAKLVKINYFMAVKKSLQTVPVLDLGKFTTGSTQEQLSFANSLGEAYRDIGFVVIKNHEFKEELRLKLYNSIKDFFELPDDIKQKYDGTSSSGQRGYTGKGKEHAAGRKVGDLKEFYHIGKHIPEIDSPHYQKNIFPSEIKSFEADTLETYHTLESIGKKMLSAIALHLGLPLNHFDSMVNRGISILRPIHYFPITDAKSLENDAVRAAEHGDINLITLLMGASSEGLQVKNRDGLWIDINTQPGEIVVNVGDMLDRYTNGVLKSTIHRVINPPNANLDKPRYSIPFFMHANPDASLASLESCITEENPKKFKDATAEEFLMERLKSIGLA